MTVENAKPGGWLFRSFHRVTSSGRYIPEVDGLRFVAIASVFLFHMRAFVGLKSSTRWAAPFYEDWLARLTNLGFAGVPLFFMISGFILSLPFAAHRLKGAEPVKLGAYFVRRLTRLEPPYLISLTAFLVMLRIVNKTPWARLLPGYLSSFVYLHNLLGDESDVINGVAWSLEIEVQFYALAPLLALVFAIRQTTVRRLLVVSTALVVAVVQWLFMDKEGILSQTLINYLQYFLAGFVLADVFLVEFGGRTGRNRGPGGGIWWDVVGVAVVAMLVWVVRRLELAPFVAPGLFFLLAVSAFQGRVVRWALSRPWVTAIGGMCYSIYLIHYQAISFFGRFTKDLPFSRYFWVALIAQTVLVGTGVLALSAAFFLLVEKPCMRKDWPARLAAWLRGKPYGVRGREAACAGLALGYGGAAVPAGDGAEVEGTPASRADP